MCIAVVVAKREEGGCFVDTHHAVSPVVSYQRERLHILLEFV